MIKKEFKDAKVFISKRYETLYFKVWRIYVFFNKVETYRELKRKIKWEILIEENNKYDIRKVLNWKKFFISLMVKTNVVNRKNNK